MAGRSLGPRPDPGQLRAGHSDPEAAYQSHSQGIPLAQGHARLHALFHRIRMRRGSKKAILAVAASMLTAIYHMLKNGTMYEDLGYNHFHTHAKDRQKNRLIKRLADMGYAVQLTALPA